MTTEAVDVVLVLGKTKIPVSVAREGGPPTVQELCEAIHRHTDIPPPAQKVIYRGRTLFKSFDPEDPSLKKGLRDLGVKSGDRVMVFGKPCEADKEREGSDHMVEELMKVLDQHQARIEEICVMCGKMVDQMGQETGTVEDWKKHRKFFLGQSEYSMQELTRLDATPGSLSQDGDYKTRRKALVNRLLENITLCDNQVSRLDKSIQEVERDGKS